MQMHAIISSSQQFRGSFYGFLVRRRNVAARSDLTDMLLLMSQECNRIVPESPFFSKKIITQMDI